MSKLIKEHREAGNYAAKLISFHSKVDRVGGRPDGSRIFGRWNSSETAYTVYSYRESWPMYTFSGGQWYGHQEKYSRSTTSHMRHAQPVQYDRIVWTSFENVATIARDGVTGWIINKLNQGKHNEL